MINRKFSVIIPIYKNPVSFLERCLDSVLDQDYKNVEVICVLDGPDKKLEKALDKYRDKVTVFVAEHGGAPSARNIGAEMADGEFYSFLDPDSTLFPGALRTWADAFDEHKDCAFVYGGYRFYHPDMLAFPSEEFDAYKLTCENYISGSFPIRAKDFPGWDKNLKSLQDWDLWLTVVKNGGKGKFLNESFFITEMPGGSSISMDSHNNWLARYNQVREKHGIKSRPVCLSSLGAPQHGLNLAKILGADYKQWVGRKPNEYEAVYSIGFYIFGGKNQIVYPFASNESINTGMPEIDGKLKKIVHWIGTDIWQLGQIKVNDLHAFVDNLKRWGFIHLCEADFTKKELAKFGIEAEVVPLPYYYDLKPVPLPKDFTVAIYNSGEASFDIYNSRLMDEISYAMPDVKFKFFGDAKRVHKEKNVEYVGRIAKEKMPEFIESCSCNVRITVHDGLPMTPCDFVMAGRNSVTSLPLPHMEYVPNTSGMIEMARYSDVKKDIIEAIRRVQKKGLNIKGSKYYKKLLSPKKYKEAINEIISKA